MPQKITKNKENRIRAIQEIFNTIKQNHENNKKINYKKMIAVVSLDKGVSMRTAKEYIDVLIQSDNIILEHGELFMESNKV